MNNEEWGRRSDAWVKSMHESRLKKENSVNTKNTETDDKIHATRDTEKTATPPLHEKSTRPERIIRNEQRKK